MPSETIKRYTLCEHDIETGDDAYLEDDPDGDWCDYEDLERVTRERDEARARAEKAEAEVARLRADYAESRVVIERLLAEQEILLQLWY